MQITDVLGVVEHDVRGVAATVGTLATLLADGRLPHAEQRNAFQRLQRAAARLEDLAADAQSLAAWTVTDSAPDRQWRITSLSAVVEGTLAATSEAGVVLEQDTPSDVWHQASVRITADSAFEDAVRALYDIVCREQGAVMSCRVRVGSGWCDVFFGPASVQNWDDARLRTPVEMLARGLKPFVALAVLSAHRAAIWRVPGGEGLGLSIPLVPATLPTPDRS